MLLLWYLFEVEQVSSTVQCDVRPQFTSRNNHLLWLRLSTSVTGLWKRIFPYFSYFCIGTILFYENDEEIIPSVRVKNEIVIVGVESNWVHSALRPLIDLLCQPRVTMMTEKLVEWSAGETKVLEENLLECPFGHHKSLMLLRREPGPLRWEASD
jgi:hypothetical protein